MKPDWNKAPEGATHHCSARNAWFKQDENDMWLAWQAYGRMHGEPLIGWCFCHAPDGKSVTARAWTGEGLPPVGTVCEANVEGTWEESTVIALDRGMAIIRRFSHEHEATMYDPVDESQIRPIRTPEQIVAEDRKAAIDAMYRVFHESPGLAAQEGIADLVDSPTANRYRDALDAKFVERNTQLKEAVA